MLLIPIIDMANHRHGSPNLVRYSYRRVHGKNEGGAPELRLELVAGESMAEGEEVRRARR